MKDGGVTLSLGPRKIATMDLEVAEWVSLERRCCGFAEFALEMRLDDTVWVKMTGKPGAKEVFAAEMGVGLTR